MVKKEKNKPIKEKKEKKKKSKVHGANIPNENHEEIKKSNILSALDKIDNKSKEETRFIEEKLRAGLIKSERSKTVEDIEKEKIEINEIKKKIENLRKLKDEHDKKEEFDESIEVSKKIITVAFSNNLKAIVNEEKKFLELTEKKVIQKSETMEILDKKDDLGSTKQEKEKMETIKENVNAKLKKARIQENKKFEEEQRKFMEEKEEFKQEKLKLEEDKEAFKWEKQMLEELKKHERDKEKDTTREEIDKEIEKNEGDEKKRFEEEKLNFEREKAKFEQEKQKYQEEREAFKQERLKFNEDKEAFKWEKQMFEEMKKHERSKE